MKCPECQLEISKDSKFCKECGCHLVEALDTVKAAFQTESERKHVTIMFSDLSGYTAMTERLDPEEVKEIMSQIFGEITRIIHKYEGFIERFIGDAVMAVFGIPKAHEDDPIRAVRAALEIHAAVEGFSPQFEGKIGRSLAMHTGINTGLVVTGEVDVEKGTHGLTGDAINLASRLEGLSKAGEIVVGESTYQLARRQFSFQATEPTQVKGKAEPIAVYRVVSVLDQQEVTQRMHGVQAKLVGREAEMAMLLEAVENLKQRKGATISIAGHAGTGKSRLIQEFKAKLEPNEVQWREGHAYAYTQNMAYYPLINLLTHAFQIREGDNPDQIREKVETGVEALLWDKPEAKKYLGSLFSLSYAKIDEVSPEFWRNQLHNYVQQILEAEASRGPTVILFEDLHWADGSFVELLHLLLKNTHRPVLFLCVYRSSFSLFTEGEPNSFAWPHEKIDLRELPWAETEAMLQSLLDASHLPDELRYFIKQKVEGNPFYLEEVINTLIETGTLTSDNGSWQIAKSLDLAVIPSTIQGVLTARVDRLEKQAKRILQEASVIGRAFFYKVLTRITELTIPLDGYLSGLESLDLIRARSREPDLEYIFKHALTQEVVYNGLLKTERQIIHERIGLVIEQLFEDRLPEFYETLAYHFTSAGADLKAVGYLVKAGEKSLQRFSLDESHHYFKQGFDLITSTTKSAHVDNEALIDLLNRWALVYYYRGDFKGLGELFFKHEKELDRIQDEEKVGMFHNWKGAIYYIKGEPVKAYDSFKKAKKIGDKNNSPIVSGYACGWLSWTCAELGLFDEGIRIGKNGLEISKSIMNDQYPYVKSLSGIGTNYFYIGHYEKCKAASEAIIEFGKNHSNIRCLSLGYLAEGHAYLVAGDFSSAIRSHKKAREVAVDRHYSIMAGCNLALSLIQNENLAEAEAVINQIHPTCRDLGIDFNVRMLDTLGSIVLLDKGQMNKGFSKLKSNLNIFKVNNSKSAITIGEHILGRIYLEIIKGEKPIKLMTVIKNLGFIIKNVPTAAKKAEAHLRNVIDAANKIGALGLMGQAHLDLGTLYKIKNRRNQASNNLKKAIEIFQETGAYVFLRQAEESLESLEK